jgi:hypothetical protein
MLAGEGYVVPATIVTFIGLRSSIPKDHQDLALGSGFSCGD